MPFPYLPLTMCFKGSLYMWKQRWSLVILGFVCQEGRVGELRWRLVEKGNIWLNILVTYPIYSSINSYPQINNKACGKVTVPLQVSKDPERVQQLILESPFGQKLLGERSIKRAILSPRTALINFLVDEWHLNACQPVTQQRETDKRGGFS